MNNNRHVIFGTGPVGLAIMDALCAEGITNIRMVNRSGRTSQPLPEGVELVNGDAADPAFATQAAEDAAYVYNALNPPYSKWQALFPALQSAVITAAEAAGAKLVVMENLYGYGHPNGQPMREDTPYDPHTRKGKLRVQMHHDLMAAHTAGRVQVVVARASDFIGPRVMQSAMGGDLVVKAAAQGKAAQMIGDVDQPHSYTYMPDVGRALVTLALTDDAYGEVWHVPTPPATTSRELLDMLYAEAAHPIKFQVAPKLLLQVVGLFQPDTGEVVEMLYEFQAPFVIDDTKFVNRFGWSATDMPTVARETVAWFQANT